MPATPASIHPLSLATPTPAQSRKPEPYHILLDDWPEYRDRIPKVVEYLHQVFQSQPPFDYELSIDDRELYCVEMAEKAFRHAGLVLSEPVLLADMENINQFPICVLGFSNLTSLKLDQAVFFPGNERHGIWSSPELTTPERFSFGKL